MLLCCQALRKSVKSFQRKHRQQVKNDKEFVSEDNGEGQHYNPLFDTLSNNNWIEVDELIDFVRVPYDLCKALEGNNVSGFGSLWQMSSTFNPCGSTAAMMLVALIITTIATLPPPSNLG
jgi:hypothetical protein